LSDREGIDRLFFELASESRIGILRQLQASDLRMQEIARRLELTDTEACRQLQRLSDAELVEKQPNATYKLTPYAKLVLDTSTALDYIHKFKNYFLEHDVTSLPYEFIERIGELSTGEFSEDTLSTLNRVRQMVYEAEEYIWVIAEQIDSSHIQVTNEKISEGLKLRFIMSRNFVQTTKFTPEMLLCPRCKKQIVLNEDEFKKRGCGFCERRQLERIGLSLFMNEKESCVVLRRTGEAMDYAAFFGTDEKFLKWTRDVFMYYWEKSERW